MEITPWNQPTTILESLIDNQVNLIWKLTKELFIRLRLCLQKNQKEPKLLLLDWSKSCTCLQSIWKMTLLYPLSIVQAMAASNVDASISAMRAVPIRTEDVAVRNSPSEFLRTALIPYRVSSTTKKNLFYVFKTTTLLNKAF